MEIDNWTVWVLRENLRDTKKKQHNTKTGEKIFRLEEAALCRYYERLAVLHSPCTAFAGAQLPGSLCPGEFSAGYLVGIASSVMY